MTKRGKPLVISEWERGMGASTHTGFGFMHGDVDKIPGTLTGKISGTNVVTAAGTANNQTVKIVKNASDSRLYKILSNGDLTRSADSGVTWSDVAGETTGSGRGKGLEYWKSHVVLLGADKVSFYNATDGFTVDELSLNAQAPTYHPTVAGTDDILYIADGRFLASLREKDGQTFNASTGSSTYTWNAQALDIPSGHVITGLAEYGQWLLIGTDQGVIFPWDRLAQSFYMPIKLGVKPIHCMIEHENLVYAFAGPSMGLYAVNNKQARLLKELPKDVITDSVVDGTAAFSATPFGIMIHDGKIKFGRLDAYNANAVWTWHRNRFTADYIVTAGSGSTGDLNEQVNIRALFPLDNISQYLVSYRYVDSDANVVENIDKAGTGTAVGQATSRWYEVATKYEERTFTNVKLLTQLEDTSGAAVGTITVLGRTSKESAFTTLATFTDTSSVLHEAPLTLTGGLVQIKITVTGSQQIIKVILE